MTATTPAAPRVALVRVEDIAFHPHNVRRDLGDLRTLTASIRRFGVMQPVVLERHGDGLRLRAGHRRVAAAKIAGLTHVPAVVHLEALDDDEWLIAALHENTRRRDIDPAERHDAIVRLRELGCSVDGIADALDISKWTVQKWLYGGQPDGPTGNGPRSKPNRPRTPDEVAEARRAASTYASRKERGTHLQVRVGPLKSLLDAWRAEHARRGVTVDELLTALDQVAATGRITGALPAPEGA